VLLRGLIDAGDYKQFIFPLLFYKRLSDVWDEEYQARWPTPAATSPTRQFAENHRFQIPEGAHWNDVRQTPKNVGAPSRRPCARIETANPDRSTASSATPLDQQGAPARRHAEEPDRALLDTRRSRWPTCPRTSWATPTST
jgi:type I restriction-modification system DNA methylase subunit